MGHVGDPRALIGPAAEPQPNLAADELLPVRQGVVIMMRHIATLSLLLLAVPLAPASADDHDCFVGSPPQCKSALVNDTSCRGVFSNDINAWQSMDCDYVIYDVKAPTPSNNYIVVHCGGRGCDSYTEDIGDFAYNVTGFNLFGLRQCSGIDSTTCTLQRSADDALHLTWTMPSQSPELGLGFNPPALIEYAKQPASQMLFLHEFDGLPSYPWGLPCNATQPAYVCVNSWDDDAAFNRKFYGTPGSPGIQQLLGSIGHTPIMPCPVEVIDARNSSATPGFVPGPSYGHYITSNRSPALPCSGIYYQPVSQGWAWEMQGYVTAGINLAITKAKEGNTSAYTDVLEPVAKAIRLALSGSANFSTISFATS
ncbi:hypothetical protein WJX72_002593 [[Myrmecia] bisecta]|uniref:Uncharacterized protein n=1 Tax=[Myrmecia] bisecta TaxID=41462 RepID=A0AAW1PWG7_9CHLO